MHNQTPKDSTPTSNRWFVVIGGLLMTMALGTFYAISVFILPLEKEFGWTRAQTSWVTILGAVMISFWYVIGGSILDRRGPRIVSIIGGLFFSLAFLLGSQLNSLATFYLTIGVCLGIGVGFGYVVPVTVGSKWFPDKRGLIVGLMVGGSGLGSGLFGPLASSLMDRFDWRVTFKIFSAIFFVMTMAAAYLLKTPPEGYSPPGWHPSEVSKASPRGADVSTANMLRMPSFWAIWIAYCLGATSGLMVISQLVPFARAAGHSAAAAAFAITVGAIGNTIGRICSGWFSDHIGRLNTVRIMLVISAVAMPILFLSRESVVLVYLSLGVVYYCYGTQFAVYPSTSADFYGTKSLGLNYGLLLTAWGAAGVLGPYLGGRVFVATGEYRWAFYTAAALSLVAVGALFFAKPPAVPELSSPLQPVLTDHA